MQPGQTATTGTACPECRAVIPAGTSMCPTCTFMLPFESAGDRPGGRPEEHRQLLVNLVPYNLRWDHAGMDRARAILQRTVQTLEQEGWLLVSSLQAQGTLVAGRTASGPIVRGAVLQLVRGRALGQEAAARSEKGHRAA